MRYSKSSSRSDEISQNLKTDGIDKKKLKNKSQSKKRIPISSHQIDSLLQVKFQNVDQTIPQNLPNPGSLSPVLFNPFFTDTHLMNQINLNYLNYGIFIPQTTENNQFFFIPGNISSDVNNIDNQLFNDKTNQFFYNEVHLQQKVSEKSLIGNEQELLHSCGSSKQLYFVPNLNSNKLSIKEELKDNEDYDTYLVPIKIKKEVNGNIELLAEPDWEMPTQQMSADQLNILRKIYLIKNQNKTEEKANQLENIVNIDDAFFENIGHAGFENGKDFLNNMEGKSEGYVMVRFNKSLVINNTTDKSEKDVASISLKLSTAESYKSSKDNNLDKHRTKRKSKVDKLSFSVQADKGLAAIRTTSRFRRLRIDDKTHCWHLNPVFCIDTKIRVIPRNILNLSKTNSDTIPQIILRLFPQPKEENLTNMIATCEHFRNPVNKGKENIKENSNKRGLWKYMCSMNNCEFSNSLTEIK